MATGELRYVEHRDMDGRLSRRAIPVDAPDDAASVGVLVGPPPLTMLELPLRLEVRLNNEFYHRGLLTVNDIRRHRTEAAAALMAACNADIDLLLASLAQIPAPKSPSGGNSNAKPRR